MLARPVAWSRPPVGSTEFAQPRPAPPLFAHGQAVPVPSPKQKGDVGEFGGTATEIRTLPPPLPAAIVALTAMLLATGALHEDGLADTADALGAGEDRDRKLEIMRDSRIGSYGVVALILCFGFRAAGLASLIESGGAFIGLAALAAASRAVLPAALVLMPPARPDGLGRSAAGTDPVPAQMAALTGILLLLPLGPGTALTVAISMALTALAVGWLAMRQIGGQTGDVMGAMQQLAECAGWACVAASI